MSNSISTMGQALDQISRLKSQQRTMDLLATQLNTQKKTQRFSGLGDDILISKRSHSNVSALDTYINNIKNVDRRINLMSTSLSHIKAQGRSILGDLQSAMEKGTYPDLQAMQDNAKAAMQYLTDLVNSQDGDRYLFSGADSATKPLTNTGTLDSILGGFVGDDTDITNPPLSASGLVGQWGSGAISTQEFIAAYRGISDSSMGYSPSLTSGTAGKVYARVSDQSQMDYTVLGNSEGIQEIMLALSVLQSLPLPQHAPGALNNPNATNPGEDWTPFPSQEKQDNFYAVIDDLSKMISGAVKKIDNETFKLAQVQSRIDLVKSNHIQESNTLKSIISNIEDVDTTEVAAKIRQLEVQLEASYSVTALVSNLSLVKFL